MRVGSSLAETVPLLAANANKLSDMPDFNDATKLGSGRGAGNPSACPAACARIGIANGCFGCKIWAILYECVGICLLVILR